MKKVGLALSSGGARGFAHIGVIKVLEQHKVPINYVAGTSMGALVAAYYALTLDIHRLEKIALAFRKRDMLKLIDLNDPRVSFIKGNKVRSLLNYIYGDKKFSDTRIPLRIGATTLEEGKRVIFSKGKILDAVIASGTVPGVFPVVKHGTKHLVDGGLADATPVDLVMEMGAEIVIAVDLFDLAYSKNRDYNSIVEVLERTYEVIMSKLANYREKEYKDNIIVLKPQTGRRIETFSFYNAKKHIIQGELEAKKHINTIIRKIK